MNYLKTIKKNIFFVYCLLFWSYICNAQLLKQRQGRLETIKMSYITKRLALSDKEAQKFWSIYPQYLGEISAEKHKYPIGNCYEKKQIEDIKKNYKEKFYIILKDSARVNQVFYLEKSYREMLKRELRKRVDTSI